VISDIADVARRLADGKGSLASPSAPAAGGVRFRAMGEVESRYYLRLALQDKPGALGQVATVLGRHHISLASVMQKEPHHAGRTVPVVILTHPALEKNLDAALRVLEEAEAVGSKSIRLRIEDPGSEK
jgi:homoserine dehydrogenase